MAEDEKDQLRNQSDEIKMSNLLKVTSLNEVTVA